MLCMNYLTHWLVAAASCAALFLAGASDLFTAEPENPPEKKVVGWLEKVYLTDYHFGLRAKMDTGAKSSSIHATDLEYVPVEGKSPQSRIRFKTEDTEGESRIIEADIIRIVKIKKTSLASAAPLTESRIEVAIDVCLAGIIKRVNVNLTDRSGMNYRMILGRTALEGSFIVDVEKKFIGGSTCRDKYVRGTPRIKDTK